MDSFYAEIAFSTATGKSLRGAYGER